MVRPAAPSSKPLRKPTTLNTNLNKGLLSYVAAACAVSGAILGETQPSDAEVVYTPTNTPILVGSPVLVDLNNDGTADFVLSNNFNAFDRHPSCTICTFGSHGSLKAGPEQAGNAIWGITSSVQSHSSRRQSGKRQQKKPNTVKEAVAPVPWGVVVGAGPERSFQSQAMPMDSSNSIYYFGGARTINSLGAWGKNRRATGPYMGFKFLINGEIHYGWARVNVQANFLHLSATLTGYAYETVANRPILTGFTHGSMDSSSDPSQENQARETQALAPGSLGQLALGAAASARPAALQPVH
jgi:hypothetical protein